MWRRQPAEWAGATTLEILWAVGAKWKAENPGFGIGVLVGSTLFAPHYGGTIADGPATAMG